MTGASVRVLGWVWGFLAQKALRARRIQGWGLMLPIDVPPGSQVWLFFSFFKEK